MPSLTQRLRSRDLILIDGATGTELERRGVPMVEHAWCGIGALTHPDVLREVHLAHIEAGAELIIANTYASSRHVLTWAGQAEHFEQSNLRAVAIAREAREIARRPDIVVAGSMSTTEQGGPIPPVELARTNFVDQARLLVDAGVDIIILEMMRDIEQTHAALDAAIATGLPLWMGVSCVVSDGEVLMWNGGVRLDETVTTLADAPIELLAVMHTECEDVDPALDVLASCWSGPVGVYAHSGRFDPPHWIFNDIISPADYGDLCMGWIERGVTVIGGCCGIGPEHIAHLRPRLDAARR